MHLSNWLLFCSVALLVTFSPGPTVLLAISNAIAVGPRRAMISSMGNGFGLFIISGVAMAGMGVVLATSATAFMLLKLAGALYLVYLGIKQWRSKTSIVADAPVAPGAANPNSFWKLFRQGLTVALTNPKAILFFSALFPQWARAQAAHHHQASAADALSGEDIALSIARWSSVRRRFISTWITALEI